MRTSEEIADFWQNFNFAAIYGHYNIIKCDKSKNDSRYGLSKSIGEENRVKNKFTEKMANGYIMPFSTEFFGFLIGYDSKTTQLRVKILPPVDF